LKPADIVIPLGFKTETISFPLDEDFVMGWEETVVPFNTWYGEFTTAVVRVVLDRDTWAKLQSDDMHPVARDYFRSVWSTYQNEGVAYRNPPLVLPS
jgi:hypothetical protein